MTRRSKIWLAVAVLFIAINFAGAVVAAAAGEVLHTGIHLGLLVLGAFAVRWLIPRRPSRALPRELTDRLTYLEQALDAIAVEVEQVGEGQREITRFVAESGGVGAARAARSQGEGHRRGP